MFAFRSLISNNFHLFFFQKSFFLSFNSFYGLLLRVTKIAVRERGSRVVLDLGITYDGDTFLGVSLMKVASHETEI